MNCSIVLPTLLALCGVAACDQPGQQTRSGPVVSPEASSTFAFVDGRLGGPVAAAAASAPARSIYSIVPN